jgi:hypothetical protein
MAPMRIPVPGRQTTGKRKRFNQLDAASAQKGTQTRGEGWGGGCPLKLMNGRNPGECRGGGQGRTTGGASILQQEGGKELPCWTAVRPPMRLKQSGRGGQTK